MLAIASGEPLNVETASLSRSSVSGLPTEDVPPVSIVVPTFNRAGLIVSTLDSVEAQSFADWECIVVDDGSTDGTADVVKPFLARDPRFRYVAQANAGASAARNHGIALARGRYVAFLDSDDHFAPDKLEWQVAALEADEEAVLAYGDALHCHSSDMRNGGIYLKELVWKPAGWAFEDLIQCSSIYAPLVRTETLRRAGGFDPELELAEDWDLWLTLSKLGKFVFEPRISLYYRVHEGNRSGTFREYSHARRVVLKQTRDLPLARRIRLRRGAFRYLHAYVPRLQREAVALAAAGDRKRARKVWRALARLHPRFVLGRRTTRNVLWAFLPR